MPKHRAQPIGALITEYLRGTEAEKTLLEKQVIEQWKNVLGESVARLTGEMEVKNGVLYVHIHSAALRQQLFENRHMVVKKLNDTVGTTILTDIRLLG